MHEKYSNTYYIRTKTRKIQYTQLREYIIDKSKQMIKNICHIKFLHDKILKTHYFRTKTVKIQYTQQI